MDIPALGNAFAQINSAAGPELAAAQQIGAKGGEAGQARETFSKFVGETFYGQMLSAMRKTVGKAAYFDGGRAEEIFRGQLDQVVSQKLAEANADSFAGPLFDLFALQQR